MKDIVNLTPQAARRLHGLMGLSVRARQATFGQDGCLGAIRGGTAALLLLDGEASEATADKYAAACESAGVPLFRLPVGMLGEATGRPGVAMTLPAGGFAEQMILLLDGNAARPTIQAITESTRSQAMQKKSPRAGKKSNCGGAITE